MKTLKQITGAITEEDKCYYIQREADLNAVQNILQNNYVMVIEPRQQGKSSLINALRRQPAMEQRVFVSLDASSLDCSNPAKWYQGLCQRMLAQLPYSADDIQCEPPLNASQWRTYLARLAGVVARENSYLTIALDELATVKFAGSSEFFSVLREIYNVRESEPHFRRINFLLAGAFSPQDLIADWHVSPFNVSIRVKIDDLTVDEVQALAARYGWEDPQVRRLVECIFHWTEGQPYLCQAFLYTYTTGKERQPAANQMQPVQEAVDKIADELLRRDENHIRALLGRLTRLLRERPDIRAELDSILTGQGPYFYPSSIEWQEKLELLGVIKGDAQNRCKIRCPLYDKALRLCLSALSLSALSSPAPSASLSTQSNLDRQSDREILRSTDSILTRRLKDLEDHIDQDYLLLKEYEDLLRVTTDPRERMRYDQAVSKVRASAIHYRQEYEEISKMLTRHATGDAAGAAAQVLKKADDLDDLSRKINLMQATLETINQLQEKTYQELQGMRSELLARFSQRQQELLREIIACMNETQLEMTSDIVTAVEENKLSEVEQLRLVEQLQEALQKIPEGALPSTETEMAKSVLNHPEMGVSHKLIISLPIIPAIITYQGEIGLDGSLKLLEWYQRIFKKKPTKD